MKKSSPEKQGLYDPCFEHDSCGIGFVVDDHGRKSHAIVEQGAAPTAGTASLSTGELGERWRIGWATRSCAGRLLGGRVGHAGGTSVLPDVQRGDSR